MFFENNFTLKNAAIYSSEEIQKSVSKKIKNIPTINNFETLEHEAVTTFITKQNPGLYNSLKISSGKTGRLAPEYIVEERAYSYVKAELKKIQDQVIKLPEDIQYNQDFFNHIMKKEDMQSVESTQIVYLLSEFQKILNIEEKTTSFGNLIHTIIKQRVLGLPYDKIVKDFLSDEKNSEIVGNYPQEAWISKIQEITDDIYKTATRNGEVITEVLITYSNNDLKVKGRIDLVTVDSSGAAHIFELKISKTNYKNWDTAKDLYIDWQLALYRQLLGQYVSISDTQLYVLPIVMEELGNPNKVKFEGVQNRKAEAGQGLYESGAISINAEKLIPRKVIGDYDPQRQDAINAKLHSLLFNKKTQKGYKVETGLEDFDVEKIMEAARRRYEKEKVWRKWNSFDDIDGLKKGYIEEETEEAFRKKIELYVQHVKTEVNRNVSIYKDAIISAIKSKIPIKTSSYTDADKHLNHLLVEYLNDNWEVITDIPEAIPMGLILLRNTSTGNINIISLSINQFYADSHIDGLNFGDLEYMKSFLFANELRKTLFPGIGKLNQIILFNPVADKDVSYYRNSNAKYKEFRQLMYDQGMQDDLKLTENDILGIQDVALYNIDVSFKTFQGSEEELKKVNSIFSKFRDTNLDMVDAEMLKETINAFIEEFPEYKGRTFESKINFSDNKEVLFAILNTALLSKSQMQAGLTGDVSKISEFSLGFSDFGSLIKGIWGGKQHTYDKQGRKIQGLVQGLIWTTPDWVANKDLQNIYRMVAIANQHIGEWMVNESNKIHSMTRSFYKAINFSDFAKQTWGETQSKHEDMWLHSGNKVSLEFKTKNPYISDNVNAMSDSSREYLQNMLLYINMWKLEIPEKDIANLNPKSLDSLMKNPKIAEAISNGSYFEMPLVRREELSKHAEAFNRNKAYNRAATAWNDLTHDEGLLKDDIRNIEKDKLGFYEMYDAYGRQTPEFKSKMIEEHGVSYFELNLDTIAHRIAFSKIRKKIYDKRLPEIASYIWWLKLVAGKQESDISTQLDSVAKQLKLSVYDDSIIDEEFEDLTKVTSVAKKVSSFAMLVLKPATFAKEMTIGLTKGISLAATQIYGKDRFTVADLMKAFVKLTTIDKKFSTEFNMIDQLNHFYRFANMDTNSISRKLQSDRWGLSKGLGPYLYSTSTLADYPNRLAIFLAMMIHDGSYDAHSYEDGKLLYDPRKDGRFSYYFENRKKYMKDGVYIPAPNDKKYNTQRQHYLLMQSELNQEYEYQGDSAYKEEDLISKAYTAKERNSIKSFIDMAYGYYDKDSQSQSHNTWWGIIYLQFMQFWPGKMKAWFAKPGGDSPMGKYTQAYIEDKETGEKKLLWRKSFEREDGTIDWEPVTENTGDPVLEWQGTPYEGLFYSLMGTLKDILTFNFKSIKNKEERNRRALFALADGVLMFIMFSIIKALFDAILEEDGDEGFTGYTLSAMSGIAGKIINEYNVYESTLGAIDSEPKFLSWGRKFANDAKDVLTGDKEVMDLMTRNIGAAEVFKW